MSIRALPLVCLLSLMAAFAASGARPVRADDEIGPAQDEQPRPDRLAWETPCDIVMPLEPLLAQSLLPAQLKPNATAKPTLVLLALDTGKTLWKVTLSSDVAAINANKDTLFVALTDRIAAVTVADGKVLWQQPLEGRLDAAWQNSPGFQQNQWFADLRAPGQGIGGALLVWKDKLFATIDNDIYALDPATGKVLWQNRKGFSLNFPLLAMGDRLFASAMDTDLTAFDAEKGDILWQCQGVKADPLFAIDGDLYAASHDALHRIDPATGAILWSAKIPSDKAESLYLCEGRVIVRRAADVWALDRNTGQQVWAAESGHQQSAYSDGRVFLRGKTGGDIYCYSVKDNAYTWQSRYTEPNLGRLFVGGSVVLAVNGFKVIAYDVATGNPLWHKAAPPGTLFDGATWAANDKAVFYKTGDWVFGSDPRKGSWVTTVPGKFHFVHWMWTRGDAVFLHSGDPGMASVGAIIVKPRETPKPGEAG